MVYCHLDRTQAGVVIQEFVGVPSDADFLAFLADDAKRVHDDLKAHRRVAVCADFSKAETISPQQRRLQADWNTREADAVRSTTVAMAFVVPTALIKGMLTAIFWLKPPNTEHAVFDTRAEALAWLAERLRAAGVDPAAKPT